MEIRDKHIGEVHGDITIIGSSAKQQQGYLFYYWCRCKCGNIKRYRYDQLRRVGNCGLCEDAHDSGLNNLIKGIYSNEN